MHAFLRKFPSFSNSRSRGTPPHGHHSQEAASCPSLYDETTDISEGHKCDEIEKGLPTSSTNYNLQVHVSSPSCYETSEEIFEEPNRRKESNPKSPNRCSIILPPNSTNVSYSSTYTAGLDLLVSAAMEISNDRGEKSFRSTFYRKDSFHTVLAQHGSAEIEEDEDEFWTRTKMRQRWGNVKRKRAQRYCVSKLPKTKASVHGDSAECSNINLAERNDNVVESARRNKPGTLMASANHVRHDSGDGRQTQRRIHGESHVIAQKKDRKCSNIAARSYKAKASAIDHEASMVEISISIDTKPLSELQKYKSTIIAMNPNVSSMMMSSVVQQHTQHSSSGTINKSRYNSSGSEGNHEGGSAENGAYGPVTSIEETWMCSYVREVDGSGAAQPKPCYGQQAVAYAERDPLVRSKRGRNQHLPTKYSDSVLQPWKRKLRVNHCHGQGSVQDIVT